MHKYSVTKMSSLVKITFFAVVSILMVYECIFADSFVDPANHKIVEDWIIEGGELAAYTGEYNEVLILPEGITTIPAYFFQGWDFNSTIRVVVIPEGVTTIGSYAFDWCFNLERVVLPYSLKTIEEGAFFGCLQLKYISFPPGLETICAYAFANCSMLEQITFPYGLKSIDDGAFFHCATFRSVTIPDTVTYVGYNAFQYAGGKWSGDIYNEIDPKPTDFVIYSSTESMAKYSAWASEILWAEPGGLPIFLDSNPLERESVALLTDSNPSARIALRFSMNDDAAIIRDYPNGTPVWIESLDRDWAFVHNGEDWGYVHCAALTPIEPFIKSTKIVMVALPESLLTTQEINFALHEAPNPESPSTSLVMAPGSTLRVTQNLVTWLAVETADHQLGYLPLNHVSLICYDPYRYIRDWGIQDSYYEPYNPLRDAGALRIVNGKNLADTVTLWAGPTESSQSLGNFFTGTQLRIHETINSEWARVAIEGSNQEGYMMLEQLIKPILIAHPDSIAY